MKVTNVSVNKVFPESFIFKCWKPSEYDLEDMNEQGVFDKSVVFNPEEIRSFIFVLSPKD